MQEQLPEINKANNGREIISEMLNNNTSEILAGGFELEEEALHDDESQPGNESLETETTNTRTEITEQDAIPSSAEPTLDHGTDINTETQALMNGAGSGTPEYKINYLVPDDEKLINVDKIKAVVNRYIDNYNAEAIKKYKQLFKTVYQKYSSKRYIINNNETEIIVSKPTSAAASRDSKSGKREIIFEVSKPKYIFYNKDNNLINMKYQIGNKRQELQLHYQSLVNKVEVQPEAKKEFEKERKKFIDLLERYYIYNLYHNQINNIALEGKANIVVQELHAFMKDNAEKKFALNGNIYSIDNTLIERINTHNSSRLDAYNELMIKLQGKKSLSSTITPTHLEKTDKSKTEKSKHEKLVDEIKEYLKSCKENTKLNNEIQKSAQTQNTYVDYIISRLPNN